MCRPGFHVFLFIFIVCCVVISIHEVFLKITNLSKSHLGHWWSFPMPLPQLGGCHTEQLTLRCRSCFWRTDWRHPHARRAGATLMMVILMSKVQFAYWRRLLRVLWKMCGLKSKSPRAKRWNGPPSTTPPFQKIHLKWMPSWFKIFSY